MYILQIRHSMTIYLYKNEKWHKLEQTIFSRIKIYKLCIKNWIKNKGYPS